jgi:hypothetical protein
MPRSHHAAATVSLEPVAVIHIATYPLQSTCTQVVRRHRRTLVIRFTAPFPGQPRCRSDPSRPTHGSTPAESPPVAPLSVPTT